MCCCLTNKLPIRRSNAKLPSKKRLVVAAECNHPYRTPCPSPHRMQQRKVTPAAARSAARKYIKVQNLPETTTPNDFLQFINEAMIRQQGRFGYYLREAPAHNCIITDSSAYLTLESPDLAHHALALNGIEYFGHKLSFGILLGSHNNNKLKRNSKGSTRGALKNCCDAMAQLKVSHHDPLK